MRRRKRLVRRLAHRFDGNEAELAYFGPRWTAEEIRSIHDRARILAAQMADLIE